MSILRHEITHEHFLITTDARVKIITALLILIMVLSYRGMRFPLVVFALGAAICAGMRVSLRSFLLRFLEPLFIVGMIVLLKFFFSGKEVLFSAPVFGFTITGHLDGLIEGLTIACRILGAVSVVAVLGFSTPFNEFMAGLAWMHVPRGFIEISMFAYRYIFMLFEDAMVIYHAQKNRLGYSSFRRSLSSFGTLAGSMTLKAFEHSQKTTVAMVQRGYDGTIPEVDHRPFRAFELALSAMFILAMGVLWTL